MISNFSTVTYYPFEMLQLVCSLGRFFVLLLVLLAESSIMAFNITRHTTGDVFENNNSSQSCSSSGAVCVFHGENQSTLCEKNCCYCVCGTRTPTYLLGEGNCSTEAYLMSVLNSTQGCDNRMIVANGISGHLGCSKELLTTLNTRRPGNTSLFFCPWDKGVLPLHYQLAKKLLKCEILPQYSRYLNNGSWVTMPSASHVGLKNLQVDIQQDPSFVDNNKLILKWTTDIGRQFDGFILSLGLKCHGQGKILNSCLHFKKSGSLTDLKPTFPPVTKPTRLSSTFVQRTASPFAEKSPTSVTKRTPTPRDVNATSFQGHLHSNTLVIVLASLAGALFVLLTCVGLLFLFRKRKRRYQTRKGSSKVNNPIYDRGASETLKLAKINHRGDEDEEEGPEYQPLVENTKPRERIDSVPGYRTLSFDQTTNQQKGPGTGVRSSNYLSLIKDDVEEGSDYQTLVKDGNPKTLEPVEEEKIPDYQELQDRTDSEDTLSGSCVSSVESVSDYEEPPGNVVAKNSAKNQFLPEREHFNDPSMENDYDEPEGVIAISDDEKDPAHVIPHFHDYAEPENSE